MSTVITRATAFQPAIFLCFGDWYRLTFTALQIPLAEQVHRAVACAFLKFSVLRN